MDHPLRLVLAMKNERWAECNQYQWIVVDMLFEVHWAMSLLTSSSLTPGLSLASFFADVLLRVWGIHQPVFIDPSIYRSQYLQHYLPDHTWSICLE